MIPGLYAKKSTNVWLIIAMLIAALWCGCNNDASTQLAEDTKAPTVGSAITFSDIRYNSFTVSWGEASDDVSPKEKLQYRVVRSSTYININTIRECAETEGDAVLRDWAEYVPSLTISDLTQQTVYWIAVLVRDEKGNMTLYYPQQVRTLPNDAPIPGQIMFNDSARTENSVHVLWGAARDDNYTSGELEYRLVKADSATKIDTVNEALAISGGDLIQDWTTNFLEKNVTGLTMGTRYYFAVLVRNPKLKVALYSPKMTTTIDTEVPTPGGNISFSGIEVDRVTVNWKAATDNLTLEGDLYYKVVRANTANQIDTEAKANAAPDVVMNWTRNKLSATATGLSEYTGYYFAVLVKDEQENMKLYTPQFVRTSDIHAPIVPVIETVGEINYYVAYSDVTGTSLKITWEQADDPDPGTPTGDLQYRLVWAESADDIDQAYKIAASSNVISGYDWVSGSFLTWDVNEQHTAQVTGRESETTYYFAVAVKDLDGNMSVYAPRMVKTKDITPPTPGTLSIVPEDVHSTWVKLTFTEATDTNYPQNELLYQVKRDSSVVHDWADYSHYRNGLKVEGLTNDTPYSFMVYVRDPEENSTNYDSVEIITHSSWEAVGIEGFATTSNDDSFALRIIGGVPHVAYLDGADTRYQYVTVQKFESDSWSAVGVAGCSGEAALQVDLEADGSGNPIIGYVAYNDNSPIAKVLQYDSGNSTWSAISGIPAPEGKAQYVDVALGTTAMGILFIDHDLIENIQYNAPMVYEHTTQWSALSDLGNVASGEHSYVSASFVYLGDVPYISFNDIEQNNKLTVKKYVSPTWSALGVAGFSSGPVMFSQLAFDSSNTPYVAYLESTANGMVVCVKKYNEYNEVEPSWDNVGISTGGYAGGLSLALFGTTPYVAFSDSTKNFKARVMKLKSNGSEWEYVEYVATGISPTYINNISISIDSSGKPYIAFRQDNKLTVMVYK